METVSGVRGIIELLDRSGKAEQRVVVGTSPVRIGRAFDNDLIVDDVHVSPHHAVIAQAEGDTRLLLRDLGSVNGIRIRESRQRVSEIVLDRERTFRLGTSQFRFKPSAPGMVEAVPLRDSHFLAHPAAIALFAVPACLAAVGWEAALGSSEKFGTLELLNAVLAPLLGILIWSGIWALVGRVVMHHARYLTHVAIVSLGLLAGSILELLSHLVCFALAIDAASSWFNAALGTAMIALILCGHLRMSTRLRTRSALVVGLVVGLLFSSASRVTHLVAGRQYSSQPRFEMILEPPALRLRSPQTTESFYARTQSLVDKVRDEPPLKSAVAP